MDSIDASRFAVTQDLFLMPWNAESHRRPPLAYRIADWAIEAKDDFFILRAVLWRSNAKDRATAVLESGIIRT
jgi:hypothetical protein